jgi:hypothetical protein
LAVKVTAWLNMAGLSEEDRLVVLELLPVVSWLTICASEPLLAM